MMYHDVPSSPWLNTEKTKINSKYHIYHIPLWLNCTLEIWNLQLQKHLITDFWLSPLKRPTLIKKYVFLVFFTSSWGIFEWWRTWMKKITRKIAFLSISSLKLLWIRSRGQNAARKKKKMWLRKYAGWATTMGLIRAICLKKFKQIKEVSTFIRSHKLVFV